MRTAVKLRALAAVIAVAAAGGCSAAPAADRPHDAGGGPAGYWTRSRLLGARPWRGPGYRPGRPANAHPARLGPQVGRCSSTMRVVIISARRAWCPARGGTC
jgi:hypothetical protein